MSRTAIVTGGGTGIGRAVAARLAAAGAHVFITGRRKDVLADAAAAIRATAVPFDATDPHAITAALAQLPERVDVLGNAAGANTDLPGGPPVEDDLVAVRESWLANFDAN